MGIFELIYGSTGQGTTIFGAWYIVGFFILGFFLLMLLSQNVSAENMLWFVLAFFLIVLNTGLFAMTAQYIAVPIVLIFLFVAFTAYNIFNK
jgi:hypothetical protein